MWSMLWNSTEDKSQSKEQRKRATKKTDSAATRGAAKQEEKGPSSAEGRPVSSHGTCQYFSACQSTSTNERACTSKSDGNNTDGTC